MESDQAAVTITLTVEGPWSLLFTRVVEPWLLIGCRVIPTRTSFRLRSSSIHAICSHGTSGRQLFPRAEIPFTTMALPLVKSALACSDFTRTVQPYIPQLNDLPQQLWQSATNPQALKQLYLNTNPLISAFAFSLLIVPIFLVISEINKNYSQVDRVWSLLPTVYNLHYVAYAHAKGLPTQRLDSLAIISSVWSVSMQSRSSQTSITDPFRSV